MVPAAALLLAGCDKATTLHAGLEEQQANLVMAALLDAGITCSKEAGEEGTWNVMVSEQKFAAALVAPDFDMLKDWCRRHGVSAQTPAEMIADKVVIARYQKVMDKYNAELGVTEQVKRFALVADTWSEANKMLTPTQKLIRRNVEAAYKEQIEALFK